MDRQSLSVSLLADMNQTSVERAISELRASRPVLIAEGADLALVVGVEGIDERLAAQLDLIAPGQARLVLPSARLRRLGLERTFPGAIALPRLDLARIEQLALTVGMQTDSPVAPALPLDMASLDLASLALVLPAMIVAPLSADDAKTLPLMAVEAEAIRAFRQSRVHSLHIVGRAPVPLEGAPQTEFVVFRGGEGLRDQVAIIVGNPDLGEAVAVRLHSACLTGDLFGSLKCDCGDQLRGTVKAMAESGGGILLYLDQEGRGNGIANKMRAYQLQSQGYDTYDADEILGFDLDQRRFDFAAEMLKQLDVTKVKVLTNNPAKIAALRRAGLDVVADQRVNGRPTAENVLYLASKRDRAGHYIDMDDVNARMAAQD
jgi:GTP cyclohydrolase II